MIVACPRAGMAPTMLYCGPGPERMLSGVVAAAIVAADAGAESGAAAKAANRTMLLVRMTVLLVLDNFQTLALRGSSGAGHGSAQRAAIQSKFLAHKTRRRDHDVCLSATRL